MTPSSSLCLPNCANLSRGNSMSMSQFAGLGQSMGGMGVPGGMPGGMDEFQSFSNENETTNQGPKIDEVD